MTKVNATTKTNPRRTKVATFTKNQLISSRKYALHKDVLNAILDADKVYTFNDVDKALKEFLEGKVS